MNRKIITYNPALKELAKKLRQNMTFSEVKLWNELKNGQLLNYDFDRQRPMGNYIIDFYCKDLQLAIEVDGITHYEIGALENDKIRQAELEKMGISFLRFDALDVINKTGSVLDDIKEWILRYELNNGISERILTKRNQVNPPRPLQGGDVNSSKE